jgi:hypothetical protein
MTRPIPFAALKGLLEQLGLQAQAVPGSHVAFKHAASGALIVLRFYQEDEELSPTDLAVARRVLDEFGVLARDEFDAALRERALAG